MNLTNPAIGRQESVTKIGSNSSNIITILTVVQKDELLTAPTQCSHYDLISGHFGHELVKNGLLDPRANQ
ncbi:MAG: hypothetical protein ACP5U1_09985 [Desulfomonilaceae bacterium]